MLVSSIKVTNTISLSVNSVLYANVSVDLFYRLEIKFYSILFLAIPLVSTATNLDKGD